MCQALELIALLIAEMETVIMDAIEIKDRKKGWSGTGLLWIVHLVCCGLLLIFLTGGISIGAAVGYLQKSFVPIGIAFSVTGLVWVGYRTWRGSTMDGNRWREK